MKHIILDTNVIYNDYHLIGTRITALCFSAKNLNHIIYIPEVVIDEFVKQYNEEVDELARSYNSSLKKLIKLKMISSESALIKSSHADYEKKVYERLEELNVKVLGYPKADHKTIVFKELYKKKPFKDSEKGYRDALIWETVKQFAKGLKGSDKLIFMSENTKDFAVKGGRGLHEDLEVDLAEAGINKKFIVYISSVHKYIEDIIVKQSQQIDQALDSLVKTGGIEDLDVMENLEIYFTKDSLDVYVRGDYFVDSPVYVPDFYDNPEITEIDIPTLSFSSVSKISDDDILIKCEAKVDVEMDFYIYRGDLYLLDDGKEPYIYDYEWNEHYAAASDTANFYIAFNIIVDNNYQIKSIDEALRKVVYPKTGHEINAY